ncbi:MAG: UbiD family decarboxylase, partial [Nitrososphaerales archaeon]
MSFEDLRGYLQRLDSEGELFRVNQQVSIKHELGAICHRSLRVRGEENRALLFENIEGYSIPIAANLLATEKRLSIALDIAQESFHKEWIHRTKNPLPPQIVDSGACKEEIYLGEDVDLYKLPHPTWNGKDGGPYITLPCQISKDPITGERNAGIYRSMVHDKRTLGILAAPYRHIAQHWLKKKGEPLPVAIAIGLHPTIYMSTASAFPKGVDEIAVAGGLRGSPFDIVKCETNDLEVPASSEIVIEGLVHPEQKHEEGPFGEYAGYYVEKGLNPIIEVTAI